MPQPPLTREAVAETIKAVEAALKEGYPRTAAKGQTPASERAGDILGIARESVINRLRNGKTRFGLEVDWTCFQASDDAREQVIKDLKEEVAKRDELASEVRTLKAALKSQREEDITRRVVREKIFEVKASEPDPPKWTVKPSRKNGVGVPTLFLSDWHWGEVVQADQVDFANEFNMEIAHARARRTVETAVDLLDNHLVGVDFPGVIVALGGDMVTGDIHEELTATNDAPIMPTVLDLFSTLVWVLETLADRYGAVFAPCVTGNHGRNTKKIQSKDRNATNFDWLVYMLLAKHFERDRRITFHIPEGSDCRYRVYDHSFLLTHGDQFRGGDGIIGPLGPITRGRHKKASRDASLDKNWDTMLCGHFHQLMQLPHLIVNGSLKGLDEYAYQGNFGFERPAQALWVNTPDQGISFQMPVYAERPEVKRGQAEWVTVPRVA